MEILEIENREYVRTNKGNIAKVIKANKFMVILDKFVMDKVESNEVITNHSKNIIDLIEIRRLCEWT